MSFAVLDLGYTDQAVVFQSARRLRILGKRAYRRTKDKGLVNRL
jgi:hypothetical protein